MNLPKTVHGIRYDKSLFGYINKNTYFSSVVFAFPNKESAENLKKIIRQVGSYPRMHLDKEDNYIIYKKSSMLPANVARRPIIHKNIIINEFDTEKLIMQCGINGIETCLVREYKETTNTFEIISYYKLAMQGADIDIIKKNLNHFVD